ncbi:MAG: DUF1330 domain-containing protein [Gammaproteobacteria bacterium]|jgi:uncharacterized protein (DUF1330 family)|nr:DUF1330 domain-containing protein [Gammaproteobacteria bacterium]
MSSYLVANYDVTNQEGYNAYLSTVGPTIVAHQGKILVAGPNSTPVEGTLVGLRWC